MFMVLSDLAKPRMRFNIFTMPPLARVTRQLHEAA